MKRRAVGALVLAAAIGVGAMTSAEPLPREQVPEPLKPWVDWVLRGHEDAACPFFEGTADRRECVWPARLTLELDDKGGRFIQQWRAYRDAWAVLPGDASRWPQDVRVDGKPAPLTLHDGSAALRLSKGRHEIAGTFLWSELPEVLPIPAETGMVALTLEGKPVPFPRRDPHGQLWLKSRAAAGAEESLLDVRVYRKLTDDVPMELTTRVELRVSGKSREVLLARALPEGFTPMALDTPLPARLEPDGRPRVQVRTGVWTLEIRARHEGPVASLALAASDGPWAPEEVWVVDARPQLRLISVEGAASIDPQQTQLPPDWKTLPAYPMRPGTTLRLVEKRRGDADPAADQLSLRRTLWLDFDGTGYTIRDDLSGALRRSWRLEMPAPAVLGRVSIGGRDQLITRMSDPARAGVEVREGQIQMEADSRLQGSIARISAVGWKQDFQQLSGVLNLPPGWRLLHASGIDSVSSTWITDWTLLDLFLVLIIAMAAARIWGRAWGVIALLTLIATFLEPDAPRWLWLALLAGEALLAALPAGRLLRVVRVYRAAVLAALLIVAIPFMVSEIRSGMYPALETPQTSALPPVSLAGGLAAAKTSAVRIPEEMAEMERAPQGQELRRFKQNAPLPGAAGASGSRFGEEHRFIDEKAAISTGPGLPRWQWSTIALSWRGPVEQGQQIHFVLLSPRVNLFLAFLRVALLAVLLLRSFRGLASRLPGSATSVAVCATLALISSSAYDAYGADFPPDELLKNLRERLLEPPDCAPSCVSSPRMRLEATATTLVVRAEIDASAQTAVPLAGGAGSWSPTKVALDGESADALVQDDGGVLWVAVGPGKHQIVLEGLLPNLDTVEIPLPLKPRRVEADVGGWRLEGLREDGLPEDSVRLVRERKSDGAAPLEPRSLPPFARVERELFLGLSWEVETVVTRLTPAGTVFNLEIPLLAGESVTTGNVRVQGGKVLVVLAPSATQMRWRSILKEAAALELEASRNPTWMEVWRLDASPLWHVEPGGIPPILSAPNVGRRVREWRPWPGETLRLALARPEAFPGQTLTVDHAAVDMSPGRRSTDVTLTLEMRSSRGGQQALTLPEGAELQSVTVNGAVQPIRQEKRIVTVPIAPGMQTIALVWRGSQGIATRIRSPEIHLGSPSVNTDTAIYMPANRWTLAAGGGRMGPAVLFWSLLFVVLLVSLALGRVESTPLRARQWFLLGIGLTQAPISVAAIVAGWLLALGWRARAGATLNDNRFNLVQVVLALWTAVALAALFLAIEQGLLGLPEMQISGNGSTAQALRWYHDRAGERLPRAWVLSLPLMVYRLAMLAWALWIAWALLSWLRWGFAAFSAGGLWRPSARAWRLSRRSAAATPPVA
jgi:hypothetical protein